MGMSIVLANVSIRFHGIRSRNRGGPHSYAIRTIGLATK